MTKCVKCGVKMYQDGEIMPNGRRYIADSKRILKPANKCYDCKRN